ncbi:MAG TPA: R3H domain-containing nucleic acid-binding protein [Candidatus Nitrosotenuis sp.]|nr:R3H domain-containing nucleic acid-binding protein [Candidatus Nitrosotenuis sp.]
MAYRFLQDGKLDRAGVIAELRNFLDVLIKNSRLELQFELRERELHEDELEHPEVRVLFRGRDHELLLERNAELLLAIEYIAHRWLRLDPRFYDHVQFDCNDYRALRLEELKLTARVAAERVVASRQPMRLNPMSARERRIIHLALKDFAGVRTESDGAGEHRVVVIHPA